MIKYESNGSSIRKCRRGFARWYISTIFVFTLPRLRDSNVHRSNNDVTLKKQKADDILQKKKTDADSADDLVLLANTPAQAESHLHSLEQAATGLGLYVNTNKTEQTCFKQKKGTISTPSDEPLKLVDQFTYLGSNISSTESDVSIRLAKVWSSVDRSLIIWKSDLFDNIKRDCFQALAVSLLLYGCTIWMQTIRRGKAWSHWHKNTMCYLEQILEATFHKIAAICNLSPIS